MAGCGGNAKDPSFPAKAAAGGRAPRLSGGAVARYRRAAAGLRLRQRACGKARRGAALCAARGIGRRSGRDRLRRVGARGRATAAGAGGARHAAGRRRSGCACGCRRSGAVELGAGTGAAGAANRFGLHRRLSARRGRLAGRPARGDALDALCRARPALSGHPGGGGPDLRARRCDLDFGRRDRRDRPGIGTGGGGRGARPGAGGGAPPGHVPQASRRAGAVQHRALAAGRRGPLRRAAQLG